MGLINSLSQEIWSWTGDIQGPKWQRNARLELQGVSAGPPAWGGRVNELHAEEGDPQPGVCPCHQDQADGVPVNHIYNVIQFIIEKI